MKVELEEDRWAGFISKLDSCLLFVIYSIVMLELQSKNSTHWIPLR